MFLSLAELKNRVQEYYPSVLVGLGWGTCLGALTLWAIFQGLLLPFTLLMGRPAPPELQVNIGPVAPIQAYYVLFFSVSVLGSMMARELGKSLLAFFLAFITTALITVGVLSLPGTIGSDPSFSGVLGAAVVGWTFIALFPSPLFAGIIGTFIGAALGEKYLN